MSLSKTHGFLMWQTTCQGKEPFESRAIASRVARKMSNEVYQCSGCGKWHVGRRKKWSGSRERRWK